MSCFGLKADQTIDQQPSALPGAYNITLTSQYCKIFQPDPFFTKGLKHRQTFIRVNYRCIHAYPFQSLPRYQHILLMSWNCQNCKKDAKKGYPCDKCQNRENNWACTTCHVCNPTGNSMKRCGAGMNPAYWWYTQKGYPCKCGNRENSWRCYNCDFNNPKGYPCKCQNRQNNWRCLNCDRDVTKGYPCKLCQNRENNWQCLNENFWIQKGYPCPKCQNRENNWQCRNEGFWIQKGYPCPKCQNRENNWNCNNCNWDTTVGYPCGKCKKQK